MKILVTGGCGFIGAHLIKKLVNEGYEVHVLDNCSFVSPIFSIIKDYVTLHKIDIEHITNLNHSFDVVVHLAAVSSLKSCEDNKLECMRINYIGTRKVVRFVKDRGSYLIFASSREVYGNPSRVPVNEAFPVNPINCYGVSKALAEREILEENLRYAVVRIANVYGYGDRPERAVPAFVINGLNNGKINVFGGDQLLDYVYIDDLINFLLILIKNNPIGIYNIGSGRGIRIIDLANFVKNLLKELKSIDPYIDVLPRRGFDVDKYIADITRARQLGWEPRVDLMTGLREVVRAYVNSLSPR
ncbi:MAG: NAD-dependent epimerase/dehydratase family protein [Thermoproteus sp.]